MYRAETKPITIKEYLRGIRKLYLEIEAKKRQRERLYSLVTGSGLPIKSESVQTSIPGDRLGDTLADIADLDNEIRQKIETLCEKQKKTARMFAGLSKPEYNAIMTDYYLNAYTWNKVADMNGYDVNNVYRIHGIALRELEDKV